MGALRSHVEPIGGVAAGPRPQTEADLGGGPGDFHAFTRHRISFNSKLFSLDFSWQQAQASPAGSGPVSGAGVPRPAPRPAAPRPWESKDELRRRQDLASLLTASPAPAPPSVPLEAALWPTFRR